jgi:hypothetical protein
MAEIIDFKARSMHGVANDYELLSDGWKLSKIKSAEPSWKIAYSSDVLDYKDLFDHEGYTVFALIDPERNIAAAFAVDLEKKWVEELLFAPQLKNRATLQVLAKTFRSKNWSMEFQWKHGFVFSETGHAYSVNALPDDIHVYGSLRIEGVRDLVFPSYFGVRGNFQLQNCTIKRAPNYLWCVDIWVSGTAGAGLADKLCGLNLTIIMSDFPRICDVAMIAKNLTITDNKTSLHMPRILSIVGELIIERARVEVGGFHSVIGGPIKETYDGSDIGYLGLDFAGRLIGPGSRLKIANPVVMKVYKLPLDINHKQNAYIEFVCRNPDNTYTCGIYNDGAIDFIDVGRMDILAIE